MLRHGMLSPNSKLLPQSEADTTRLSIMSSSSYASNTSNLSLMSTTSTSSKHPKDARDTLRRRVRHRDGKLLQGGIGLTTGLGWSDRLVSCLLSAWSDSRRGDGSGGRKRTGSAHGLVFLCSGGRNIRLLRPLRVARRLPWWDDRRPCSVPLGCRSLPNVLLSCFLPFLDTDLTLLQRRRRCAFSAHSARVLACPLPAYLVFFHRVESVPRKIHLPQHPPRGR